MTPLNHHQSDTIGMVVYNDNGFGSFIKFKKRWLHFFFYILPFLTILSFTIIFYLLSHFKSIRQSQVSGADKLVVKNEELQMEIKNLHLLIAETEKKLLSTPDKNMKDELGLFQIIPGQQDFRDKNLSKIENVILKAKGTNTISLQFGITNLTQEQKRLTGHIFAMLNMGNALYFYPSSPFSEDDMKLSLSKGEPFSAFRFRPVDIEFQVKQIEKKALLKIFIFSRTGDILNILTTSQEVEAT